jgi:hypothetical protein
MKSQKKQFSRRRYNTKLRIKKRKQMVSKKRKRRFNKSRKKQRGGQNFSIEGKSLLEKGASRNGSSNSLDCYKHHIFANIEGTLLFLFKVYLVSEEELQLLQKTPQDFLTAYTSSLDSGAVVKQSDAHCDTKGKISIYETPEQAFDFENFLEEIRKLLYPKELKHPSGKFVDNIKEMCYTLKKYLMFNKYLKESELVVNDKLKALVDATYTAIAKAKEAEAAAAEAEAAAAEAAVAEALPEAAAINPFARYENNITHLRTILSESKYGNRTFMVGFSLLQALTLLSPNFNKLIILTCHGWNMKKNDFFIKELLTHVLNSGNAYVFLPPFLRKEDIVTKKQVFRVTLLEIGIILKNNFNLTPVTILSERDNKLISQIKGKDSPFNYPELMRIYKIVAHTPSPHIRKKIMFEFPSEPQRLPKNYVLQGQTRLVKDGCSRIAPEHKRGIKVYQHVRDPKRPFGCLALSWLKEQGIFVDEIDDLSTIQYGLELYTRNDMDMTQKLDLTTTLTTPDHTNNTEDPLKKMYDYVSNPDNL